MRRLLALLLATPWSLGAQEAPDISRLVKLAGHLRDFAAADLSAMDQTTLDQLYRATRGNHVALKEPSSDVKATLARELGPNTLAWWDMHIDQVIGRWAEANADLAAELKAADFEWPRRPESPGRWWRTAKDAALIAVVLPFMILEEVARGPLSGPGSLASLPYDLVLSTGDQRARSVLGLRRALKESYAESCHGRL